MAQTMDYFNYTGNIAAQSGVSKRTYTGTSAADNFLGTDLNEAFIGNLGADTLAGGAGDDLYVVQNSTTLVIEGANAGIDTVKVTMDYVLPENVENLLLCGLAAGYERACSIDLSATSVRKISPDIGLFSL